MRAQLDPANEQRAASIASLARSLSRAATGNPQANPGGDPEETKDDLKDLGDKLDDDDPGASATPRLATSPSCRGRRTRPMAPPARRSATRSPA